MIRQDAVSFFFFAISMTSLAFIFVSGQTLLTTISFATITMLFLATIGLIGEPLANRLQRHPEVDVNTSIDHDDAMNITIAFLIGLIGLLLSSLFVPQITNFSGALSVVSFLGVIPLATTGFNNFFGSIIFSAVLVPTSEENFFRGFWANVAIAKLGSFGGLVAQATIFMAFHIPAYGWVPATLGIIFMDGLILGAIDNQAQSITPSILAHSMNNLLYFLTLAGVVVLPFVPHAVLGVPFIVTLRIPISLAIFSVWKRAKGRKG